MVTVFFLVLIAFAIAYKVYGAFLDKTFDIKKDRKTPSHLFNDGIDKVPTKPSVLMGHHFASIAGAGPVVGPIIAALAFGWLPALLWIVLGTIFVGGVHDYTSLVASIRHKAKSIAELVKVYMSARAYRMMLAFIWLALVYILAVFVDLTATSFSNQGEVASSSGMFVLLALLFGFLVFRKGISSKWMSIICVPILFLLFYAAFYVPLSIEGFWGMDSKQVWSLILLAYCVCASLLPVWALLQPRDYLSSFLLYAGIVGAVLGLALGDFDFNYPMFKDWSSIDHGTLFPILFITVACGACSGFHSIVASGTTSKQLDKETDARPVGYGSMLLEGALAVIALFTVAMLGSDTNLADKSPLAIYGAGMGSFLHALGLPTAWGESFGLLTISTFLLTTLDTSTRLAGYVVEEFLGTRTFWTKLWALVLTLLLPLSFVFLRLEDALGNVLPVWKAVWPVFGATNQLLAALALLVVFVWMNREGKPAWFVGVPMVFMFVMTLWALGQLVYASGLTLIGGIGFMLLLLAIWMVYEALLVLFSLSKAGGETVLGSE